MSKPLINCPSCGAEITNFSSPFCPKCLVRIDKILPNKDPLNLQGHLGRGVDKNHIDEAKSKFFYKNESMIATYKGSDPGLGLFKQYLIITDMRVIFWKRGITEINQTFNFEDIGSVGEYRSFLKVNGLELNIKGAKEIFPYMYDEELSQAIRIIRELIQKTKDKPLTATVSESIPDQIKKLAELRDSGILTDQEFQTKKVELLKRL